MKIILCTDRDSLCKLISDFLKGEVEFLEFLPINKELVDNIYKINPDLILFDLCKKGKLKWKLIENLTRVPSLREKPLIVILNRKLKSQIRKLCEFEIFDYLIEDFLKCELLMKISKTREILDLKKEFERLLTKDPLTGAYNRRFLMERIQEEINWCYFYKESLSLALFDIDFFKKINDTYGHLSGDRVLIELVSLAGKCLPSRVTIGRYGGEEFCVIMPSTNEKEAYEICENFRKIVSDSTFYTFSGEAINLSISIGVTTLYGEDLVTPDELIQKADIALYKAKRFGRNRVVIEPFVVK
ncbi:MAG: GGDEF domain-containing protein [Thermodesulfovibrio sp.]|nr:GGDEF domain-containing protein [Thermodesulfovibrio sp.]MCX7724597.1 GGDEF domain-containing protein [Thermodesulfovibrio sp.]MDW7972968.1 GGDEF domain-containing protein [Thermodesulfovibrio sp.]